MKRPLLIVRPEPGASATAARAIDAGWQVLVRPIFAVEPITWDAPDPSAFDALIVTSANAVRHAGPQLGAYRSLPIYAVGGATAAALRAGGFQTIRTGQGDAAALLSLAAQDGIGRALHLAGMDHKDAAQPGIRLERRILYRSAPLATLSGSAVDLLRADQPIVLLHSGRAAAHFAGLCGHYEISRDAIRVATLAPAIATDAGTGWAGVESAETPDDMALLAAAARLCH